MDVSERPEPIPRWGNEDRAGKAEAIWQTLLHFRGPGVGTGIWLDIGCGSGGIAANLASRVERVIGFDPEAWPLWELLRQQHANLELHAGGIEDLSPGPPSAMFDVVICNQVYEHVPDPRALISSIHRCLKPGGVCYFAGPNLLFPIEPHVFWPCVHWLPRGFARALMRVLGSKQWRDLDAYSTDYWTLKSWFEPYFHVTNAVPFMLRRVSMARWAGIGRLLAFMPEGMIDFLTPLSPGFVFVLEKKT